MIKRIIKINDAKNHQKPRNRKITIINPKIKNKNTKNRNKYKRK